MNTVLRMMPVNNIVFFDIETVRASKTLPKKGPEFDVWSYLKRDRETEVIPPYEELAELYNRTAALNPAFATIACISVGYVKNGQIKVKAITGTEEEILVEFLSIIGNKMFSKLGGMNILRFDLSFIEKKCVKYGLKLPDVYSSYLAKPWTTTERIIDLLDIWKGFSYISDSLQLISYQLGLPNPKKDLHGSEVSEVFYKDGKKGIERISIYCNNDVVSAINILLVIQGKQPILGDNVIYG